MPPIASLPNSALCGPLTVSTCATSPNGSSEKSRPPPNAFTLQAVHEDERVVGLAAAREDGGQRAATAASARR